MEKDTYCGGSGSVSSRPILFGHFYLGSWAHRDLHFIPLKAWFIVNPSQTKFLTFWLVFNVERYVSVVGRGLVHAWCMPSWTIYRFGWNGTDRKLYSQYEHKWLRTSLVPIWNGTLSFPLASWPKRQMESIWFPMFDVFTVYKWLKMINAKCLWQHHLKWQTSTGASVTVHSFVVFGHFCMIKMANIRSQTYLVCHFGQDACEPSWPFF